jgi:cobalt/nickel transport system permease protein
MHIPDGVLSNSLPGVVALGAGGLLAAAGTALGLGKMDYERVPRVAVLSSAFFVVSLIHFPLLGTSAHLLLAGLLGLVLGWAAFPAVLVALLLQAVLFQHGGLTTLGLNTVIMATPAVVCYWLFGRAIRGRRQGLVSAAGFAAGAAAVLLSAVLTAAAWWSAGRQFWPVSVAALSANLPVAVVEGLVTGSAVLFLRRVRPELLEAPLLAQRATEVPYA